MQSNVQMNKALPTPQVYPILKWWDFGFNWTNFETSPPSLLSTPSLLLFLLLIYDYLSLNHHSFYYNSNYCYQTYFKAWLFWQINHYELIIFVCCVTFLSVGSRYVYGWKFFLENIMRGYGHHKWKKYCQFFFPRHI